MTNEHFERVTAQIVELGERISELENKNKELEKEKEVLQGQLIEIEAALRLLIKGVKNGEVSRDGLA